MADYVVVGAGSAGCLLASRLSEGPKRTVVLLEAGPAKLPNEARIPAAFGKLFKSPVDWCYYTEDQRCLNGRKLYWPRGRMIGGSSSMNAMIWIRGRRSDYDRWRDKGAAGWCWDCVAPAFDKLDWLHATLRTINPITEAFIAACVEQGIARTQDFNDAEQWGAGYYRVCQKNGRRFGAAQAFIDPVRSRANLRIESCAHATRVLIAGNRARGVEYVQGGRTQQVMADREVILCGGAINSPQLLMLSGIGPAEHLRSLNIPVVIDLPGVGENLEDHLMSGVCYASKQPVSLASAESLWNLLKYVTAGTGPLTSNVAEAGAFPSQLPEVQYHFAPAFYIEHGFRRPEGHGYSIGPTLVRPRSVGRLRLRSADPFEHPAIDPRYLSDPADLDHLLAGIELGREIGESRAFVQYRGEEVLPGAAVRTREQLTEYVANNAETLYHPTSTCRIGTDAMSVVDGYLSVHGMERLRVADASVMPDVPSGNTNAPTLMIAEKAATFLLANA